MTRTQKFILVFVFIFLSLWRLFEIPAVAEAFWAFCTVGALPWTDQIVPPKLMLKFLIMAFPLALLIIFRKEFLAAVPRRRFADESVVMPAAVPKPARAGRKPKSPVVIVLPLKAKTPLRVRAQKATRVTVKAIDITAEKIYYYESKLARAMLRGTKALLATLWNGVIALGSIIRAVGRLLVWLWHLTEPYIRQFDHWLNVTLHQSKKISLILDAGTEASRAAAHIAQKAQALKRTQRS